MNTAVVEQAPFGTEFMTEAFEASPFTDTATQDLFAMWCDINDSITPVFMTREDWQDRADSGVLSENQHGGLELSLPNDLKLWEMIDVIATIDQDTLSRKPQEERYRRTEKLLFLGEVFEDTGKYLFGYLDIFEEDEPAREIIESMASKFYQYGRSLQEKRMPTDELPVDTSLSGEDRAKIDEWLLGRDLYQKRVKRLGENPDENKVERARRRALKAYFRGLTKVGFSSDGENPWESVGGPLQHLQDRSREQIAVALGSPERELRTAIFRRGKKKLVTEMLEPENEDALSDRAAYILGSLGLYKQEEARTLYEALDVDALRLELAETRTTGDVELVSAKELEFARTIQEVVSSYSYKDSANYPSEMVETKSINCTGASILGGSLLEELGIEYLHTGTPIHSMTILVTSNGRAYWQDFTPGFYEDNYNEVDLGLIEEALFSEQTNLRAAGLNVQHQDPDKMTDEASMYISGREGLQYQVLYNTGTHLDKLGRHEEALSMYRYAIDLDGDDPSAHLGAGYALSQLGDQEEALKAYRFAISKDQKNPIAYEGLSGVMKRLGRIEEAAIAMLKAEELEKKTS